MEPLLEALSAVTTGMCARPAAIVATAEVDQAQKNAFEGHQRIKFRRMADAFLFSGQAT
jgi:hypothetical protein